MASNYIGPADQKEFVKRFDSLTGKYSRWQIWNDLILMIACAISNSVDMVNFEKREQMYMDAVRKYKPEETVEFPSLYGLLVKSMDERVSRGDFGDFLGEMFMQMGLGNDLGGQFFTPYHVCLLMAESVVDEGRMKAAMDRDGYISCSDVACGAGATLIAAAETVKKMGINYQEQVMFAGQDIDMTTALMCYIQLSLLGCAGYVVIGNTLTEPMTGHPLFGEDSERCWKTPMYFSDIWFHRRHNEQMRQIIRNMEANRKIEAAATFRMDKASGQMMMNF